VPRRLNKWEFVRGHGEDRVLPFCTSIIVTRDTWERSGGHQAAEIWTAHSGSAQHRS
jgi:hypothetical protein